MPTLKFEQSFKTFLKVINIFFLIIHLLLFIRLLQSILYLQIQFIYFSLIIFLTFCYFSLSILSLTCFFLYYYLGLDNLNQKIFNNIVSYSFSLYLFLNFNIHHNLL